MTGIESIAVKLKSRWSQALVSARRRGLLLQGSFVLGAIGLFGLLEWMQPQPLRRVENALRDVTARMGRKAPVSPNLVFLAVDDASLGISERLDLAQIFALQNEPSDSARALRLMSRTFPWSREVYGLALDRLAAVGARCVVFDFSFPKAHETDAPFAAALARNRDRVILGVNFSTEEMAEDDGFQKVQIIAPPVSLLPDRTLGDERLGFDNFWVDDDSFTRVARYRAVAEMVNPGSITPPDSQEYSALAARIAEREPGGKMVPKDREPHYIRFAGGSGTFRARPLYEIFAPDYWKRHFQSGEFFRDKIVVIGAAGEWSHDEILTPFGVMPGAEMHLEAANAAITGEFISELPQPGGVLLVSLAGLMSWLLWLRVRRPMLRLVCFLAVDVMWLGMVLYFFDHAALFLPSVCPLLALNITGVSGLGADLARERRSTQQAQRTLGRYVSQNVVREMLDNPEDYLQTLGGVMRPATILFSDIRAFTKVTANLDAHALVEQLNEYFTAMVECVFRHGGTLDKFIGDAVMAVWGNARSLGPAEDAKAALRCAVEMGEELVRLNARWEQEGRAPFKIGVAINHGNVVAGNIGSLRRMEFTVIGDAVNLTWRIQECTKQPGCNLLLGESVVELVGPSFAVEYAGEVRDGAALLTRYFRPAPVAAS